MCEQPASPLGQPNVSACRFFAVQYSWFFSHCSAVVEPNLHTLRENIIIIYCVFVVCIPLFFASLRFDCFVFLCHTHARAQTKLNLLFARRNKFCFIRSPSCPCLFPPLLLCLFRYFWILDFIAQHLLFSACIHYMRIVYQKWVSVDGKHFFLLISILLSKLLLMRLLLYCIVFLNVENFVEQKKINTKCWRQITFECLRIYYVFSSPKQTKNAGEKCRKK